MSSAVNSFSTIYIKHCKKVTLGDKIKISSAYIKTLRQTKRKL